MIYIFAWAIGTIVGFVALRHLALRDFGSITIGGLIVLSLYSLLVPAALVTAFLVWLLAAEPPGFLAKRVWTRR